MNARHLAALARIVTEVRERAQAQGKLAAFCVGNTRKVSEGGLYFSPIRETARLVAGSVIVYQAGQAAWVATQVDGLVEYVFVDTEKKVGASGEQEIVNVEREVREALTHSRVLTYKGNDLTADSIEYLVVQLVSSHPRGLGGKKGVIIGAGNVGAKLALKLLERGMDMTLTRRDAAKLDAVVQALNIIKPAETVAVAHGTTDNESATAGAHLVVGLTHGTEAISASMIDRVADGCFLLDGGKGCFSPAAVRRARERGLAIYRADIRAGFDGHSAMALRTEEISSHGIGRAHFAGVPVVSGGLLGEPDEVVVDNVHAPTQVFGLANGLGDFVREPDAAQLAALAAVRDHIQTLNSARTVR